MGELATIQHFRIKHQTLWHQNQMPSMICSRAEFTEGQHNKGHNRPSAICVVH